LNEFKLINAYDSNKIPEEEAPVKSCFAVLSEVFLPWTNRDLRREVAIDPATLIFCTDRTHASSLRYRHLRYRQLPQR
jgi:hypothetical protein